MALQLNINDETSCLETVILGIGQDMGGPSSLNPKSRFHVEQDSYPVQEDILREIATLENALIENGVKVLRPRNTKNLLQIFTRDVGFVIGDTFYASAMVKERQSEIDGVAYITDLMDKVVHVSKEDKLAKIEGGDVIVHKEKVFVGLSARTNNEGFLFLKERLKGKKDVLQIEVVTDKNDHTVNVLHLDCTFQPLGNGHAIVYEDGIKDVNYLYQNLNMNPGNIFKVNKWQFVRMFPNIFSISNNTIIIEREFIELKYWLLERGFNVVEVNYKQISKLSGLLRCSTLPLYRK